ncbi:MAG: T9SS type A sorting domain-containing protein, partial [Chitinophagales bacterium]|nr:T9SS type A sorting domain-containing protein [Chitinophagales bacterium]
TDSNGCTNSATIDVVLTGIENLFTDTQISIYPNPSNGNFVIELLNSNSRFLLIEIVNVLGEKIYSVAENLSSSNLKMKLDLENVTQGIYFIEIKTETYYVKKKLLIEK